MKASTAVLVLVPGDGPQLGAEGSQVGVLHLLGLALFGLGCCHSRC